MTYTIEYDHERKAEDIKILNDGLAEHAKKLMDFSPTEYFTFFVRDENQKIKGGCDGSVLYGSIHIRVLWIDESLRNNGYGKKLMLTVEEFAHQKQCTFITLQTMNWGALDFYASLGYAVEFTRTGYCNNTVFYLLRKDL